MGGKSGYHYQLLFISMMFSLPAICGNMLAPSFSRLAHHPSKQSHLIEFRSRNFNDLERDRNMTRHKRQIEKQYGITFQSLNIDRDPDAAQLHAILSAHIGPNLEKTPFFYNRRTGASTYGSPLFENFKAWVIGDPSYSADRDFVLKTQREISVADLLSPPLTVDEALSAGLNQEEEDIISRFAANPRVAFAAFTNTTRALAEGISWKGIYNWILPGSIIKLPQEERTIVQVKELLSSTRMKAYSAASAHLPKYAQYILKVSNWKVPDERSKLSRMKSAIGKLFVSSSSLIPRVLLEIGHSPRRGTRNFRQSGAPETYWKRIQRFPSCIITRKSL
jgi:hypothetical protein